MSVGYAISILLSGVANASTLFLIAAGLSLIFGVSRIVNFAHGSFYMLGSYIAYTFLLSFGQTAGGFVIAVLASAICLGVVGILVEVTLLRRLYRAPELFQLLTTFGLALVIKDIVLWIWGPESLLAPRVPGLGGSLEFLGHAVPQYDIALILCGVLVFVGLQALLYRTFWGTVVRAATEDREMVGALGINQAILFTSVFALGAFLAGLGGALQVSRSPADLTTGLTAISDAFVVVVVGGMGSIPGAALAALLVGIARAACFGVGQVSLFGTEIMLSKLTLVIEFVIMAAVLVVKPQGLLGKQEPKIRALHKPALVAMFPHVPLIPIAAISITALASIPFVVDGYQLVFLTDAFLAMLFAASLAFILATGGMVSFGHAAYFGLGAYGAAILTKSAGVPIELSFVGGAVIAALGSALFGWFSVRLSGVYLAMLTLAFAQIVWSIVYQWDGLTGGSNGLVGLWPPEWLSTKKALFYLALTVTVLGVSVLYVFLTAPFGLSLRATRDSPRRCEAIGINRIAVQWSAFVVAGAVAGLAGSIYAFTKGSISADLVGVTRSIDALVMVMLGGGQTLLGAMVGAAAFSWLQDYVARLTEHWNALLGVVIVMISLLQSGSLSRILNRPIKLAS